MKRKRLCNILLLLLLASSCWAQTDTAVAKQPIYMGTQMKLDIASPIVIPAMNKWQMQHYEMAVNVRLANRFYPTFEAGYVGGKTNQGDSIAYQGQGGFFRVGCDINPLKKHPESPHALLVGLRLGTAAQDWNQQYTNGNDPEHKVSGDCWGEIVAGCQVEIAKVNRTAFYMGWMGRFKCLFTRKQESPIYIPGYGKRDNIGWGLNYYLGWRF